MFIAALPSWNKFTMQHVFWGILINLQLEIFATKACFTAAAPRAICNRSFRIGPTPRLMQTGTEPDILHYEYNNEYIKLKLTHYIH